MSPLPTSLPGGAPLAAGESVLLDARFMFSTTAPYMHTHLALTNRRIYAMRPNTVFYKQIPVGTRRESYPIESVAGISARTRFRFDALIFGLLLILVGLALIYPVPILGILLLLWGIMYVASSPTQGIEIMNSGGGVIRFPVAVFERARTVAFVNEMSAIMARSRTIYDGSHTAATAPATAAPGVSVAPNPGDALRHLQDLHNQGLITGDEYTAKRSEILARL